MIHGYKVSKKSGEIVIPILTITVFFIILITLVFAVCIYYINIYSVVYDYKIDLYNLNRNAIMSVNIQEGGYGQYIYDENVYLDTFKELLKKQYDLNEELCNTKKMISKIEIIEYRILKKGEYDITLNKMVNQDVIHVVTNITYIPVVFKSLFKDNCTFTVHNDISIIQYE